MTEAVTPRAQPEPDHLDHLAELIAFQDAFHTSIGEVDPDARVPWCGRWRVRDVVVHLGRVHHWAAAQAGRTREVPLGRGPFDLAPFYRTQATELRDTLVRLGPDAIGSTFDGPGPASFWRRRQTHETLVHLWDVRTAGGLRTDAPVLVWADTVDEVVTMMAPRQVRLGRMPDLDVGIRLDADDAGREWLLGGSSGAGAAGAAVRVAGPAADLALMLWKRIATDHPTLRVEGDPGVLADVVGRALTP